MLQPRIIPSLLIHKKGLVKTVNFTNPKYVGDPINAVKIFNEKAVDELIVTDIDASVNNKEPDYSMIEKLAMECRMPLCYGGGITNTEQAKRIFNLGVEKIAISSAAINNPSIITELSASVGSQSVVVVLDIKKKFMTNNYSVLINNGKYKTGINLTSFVSSLQELGAGEIVLNSIDRDGTMKGYDYKAINQVRSNTTLPLTVLGGAGNLDDIGELISKYGIIGAAAGSIFVFKGKYRAVLINYPNAKEKMELLKKYMTINNY
jgi:cyclase|tara:strand:- start:15013 stop:15801 length:789 start_codon:yes stop_codon:yes gene_type:complete